MKIRNKNMFVFGLFCLAVAAAILAYPRPHEIHEHADFVVYIGDEHYNFSQERYMTDSSKTLSAYAHLHDGNGNVIHKHADGITLGYFFASLGMKLNSTCFDAGHCNDGTNDLRMFVNGQPSSEYERYEFRDLDRILISYGNYSQERIGEMIASVTDEACIQSLKCPERGAPAEESCTGGICEE